MTETLSLLRQVAHRAERWRPPKEGARERLLRQYPLRPFVYALRAGPKDCWRDLPRQVLRCAPMDRAYYEAVVDEVDRKGRIHLSVWEYPSGRAFYLCLPSLEGVPRRGPEPAAGDRLRLWTWVELPGQGAVCSRRFVRVLRRRLGPGTRAKLARLAAALEP